MGKTLASILKKLVGEGLQEASFNNDAEWFDRKEKEKMSPDEAGYTDDDITIQLEDNVLSVKGDKGEDEQNYISKGIAYRKFEKRWTLGEYMVVDGASFENGLLKVYISKVVPDEKKPRTIEINGKKTKKSTLLKG